MRAFGADKKDPTQPAKGYEDLTLHDHVQLIITDGNWQKFEAFLGPKALFTQMMDKVGQIRNQQMHFRGEIDPVQFNGLVSARDWLDSRPKPAVKDEPQQTVHVVAQDVPETRPAGKYGTLENWLINQKTKANLIRVSFADVQELLGEALPQSAYEQRTWWANDTVGHVQSRAWLRAGWKIEEVDLARQEVAFKQTLYGPMRVFLADVLQQIKELRPGLTRATKTAEQNWISIGGGKSGFTFAWVFTNDESLRIELYIDTGEKEQNKAAFDHLKEQQAEIEQAFGGKLIWDRLDNKQASRIYITHPIRLNDPPAKLEPVKQWAIETGLRLIDAFQSRVRELSIK